MVSWRLSFSLLPPSVWKPPGNPDGEREREILHSPSLFLLPVPNETHKPDLCWKRERERVRCCSRREGGMNCTCLFGCSSRRRRRRRRRRGRGRRLSLCQPPLPSLLPPSLPSICERAAPRRSWKGFTFLVVAFLGIFGPLCWGLHPCAPTCASHSGRLFWPGGSCFFLLSPLPLSSPVMMLAASLTPFFPLIVKLFLCVVEVIFSSSVNLPFSV